MESRSVWVRTAAPGCPAEGKRELLEESISMIGVGLPARASRATAKCVVSQISRELLLSFNSFATWSAWNAVSSGTAVQPAAMMPR